jgi:putative membrane protein
MDPTLLTNVIAAVVFALIGIVILFGSFVAIDRLTPYALWKEIIDDHNTALAILVGAVALGISIIVAAAIH